MSFATVRPLVLLLPLTLLGAASANAQLGPGDKCTLTETVEAKLRNDNAGEMRTEIAAGTDIVVEKPGRFFTRIVAGDVEALIATELLAGACPAKHEVCRLTAPMKMAVGDGDDRKIFKVKAGADVFVLGRGPRRTQVRVGDIVGQMNSDHIAKACTPIQGQRLPKAGPKVDDVLRVTRARPGIKGAVLPFAFTAAVNPLEVRMFEDQLGDALKSVRKDAMGTPSTRPDDRKLRRNLKEHVEEMRKIAAAMGLKYFVTGHLSGDGTRFTLGLGVIDVKSGRMLKGVKAQPTLQAGDPWAEHAAGFLQEVLPGGTDYTPPKKAEGQAGSATEEVRTSGGGFYDRPFFLNGLAWTTLGTGAALAAGGAASGYWASTDITAHGATTPTDPARQQLADLALGKAIAADGLYGAAIIAVGLSLVFFVTGVDF